MGFIGNIIAFPLYVHIPIYNATIYFTISQLFHKLYISATCSGACLIHTEISQRVWLRSRRVSITPRLHREWLDATRVVFLVAPGLKPRSWLRSSFIGHIRICRALKSGVLYHVVKYFKQIGHQWCNLT